MAEFKFSCPQCGQHIQCDPGYSGMQINCPSCQQAIVVPPAPRFTAAPTAPPVPPPAPPGLSTKQSTTVPATGRRFAGAPGAQPAAKPKSKALKTVLVITASVLILAGLVAGVWWFGIPKYKEHKAAQEAKKGNPAAQVPTPTATAATGALDVLVKVHQAYTNLTSLNVEGTSVSVIDMSAVTAADLNPNQAANTKNAARRPANIPKAITNTTTVAIKLARPDLYRIEGIGKTAVGRMTMTNTIAIWSPGKTNYSLMIVGGGGGGQAYKSYTTVKDRNTAFAMTGQSGGLAMGIPQLFFDETGMMGNLIKDWGQTGDESLNGQDCYTLTGKMLGQKLKIWVNKTSYMILQSQITLGGAVSDADINAALDAFNTSTNQAQVAQQKAQAKQAAAMITKIRGTVTETYDTVEMNQTLTADDFNYPVPRGVRLTPSQF